MNTRKAEWNATDFMEELDAKITNEESLYQREMGRRDLAMVSTGVHMGKMQAYQELKERLQKLFEDNAVEGE